MNFSSAMVSYLTPVKGLLEPSVRIDTFITLVKELLKTFLYDDELFGPS